MQVTRQRDSICFAPLTASITKCRRKALTHMVMEVVACLGYLSLRQFPKQLRKFLNNTVAKRFPEASVKCRSPREAGILDALRCRKVCFEANMRLISKNGRDRIAEIIANRFLVPFMGDLHKALYGRFAHSVHIGTAIIPTR